MRHLRQRLLKHGAWLAVFMAYLLAQSAVVQAHVHREAVGAAIEGSASGSIQTSEPASASLFDAGRSVDCSICQVLSHGSAPLIPLSAFLATQIIKVYVVALRAASPPRIRLTAYDWQSRGPPAFLPA